MASYNINDITRRDGKLYAGGVEVGANDTVNTYRQMPVKGEDGSIAAYDQMLSSSQTGSDYLKYLGSNRVSSTDPLLRFADTGTNRNALYGAYMDYSPAQESPYVSTGDGGLQFRGDGGWMAAPESAGSFQRHMGIPDLSKYDGGQYNLTDDFTGPTSQKSAEMAQAILKKLYPNVSQDEMDKAAYAAYQKGDKYYSGTGAPSENNTEPYYYGHGPMPVVTAIAKQLGMTPEANQFITDNWSKVANEFAQMREGVKAQAKAKQQSLTTDALKGVGMVLGGAAGLGSLFGTGLTGAGGLLGGGSEIFGPAMESGAMGTTGAIGTTGGSMFDGLGDWFSSLLDGGSSATSGGNWWDAWDPSIADSALSASDWGGAAAGSTGGNWWDAWDPNISDPSIASPEDWGSAGSSLMDQAKNYIMQNPGSTVKTALQALTGGNGGLLSGGLSALGGYLSGNAAQDAASKAANAQIEAARIAADAAKFKPVGVTTRFGQSNFTKDAQGNVTSAGYTMPTDIKAMQDSLIGAAPGMLNQFTGSQAATAPMGTAAQRAMTLGQGYLNADPLAQAQKFYDDQQAIMATQRARDQAGALTGEFNRGTYGLATGATGMMGAANPRLEAMYNAQRQQDLQAAANATQGGMDYAKFGAGLVGTGGNMLRDMYGTQVASLDPYKAAMGGAQGIEGLGQNALDLSVNMGKVASPADAGRLMAGGMLGAANTMQQANQYSPWGTALMNAGNALGSMQQPQQQAGYMFNPFTGVRL